MLNTLEVDRIQFAELDAQILHLEHQLAELQSKRAVVKARLDASKYPVLTIPSEIISEIFLHFLPPYPQCPPLTGVDSPTTLTHICSVWREIALSTPQLWRAITVADIDSGRLHIAEAWLSQSGCHPLSLLVHDRIGDDVERQILRAALISQRARFENLISICSESQADLSILDGPMPLLHHLELDMWSRGVSVTQEIAPLLRSAVLSDTACVLAQLPWKQLTSLTLQWGLGMEFVTILQQTPNLLRCVLLVTSAGGPPLPEVRLPLLGSLTLGTELEMTEERMFFSLITPALHTLRVSEQCLGEDPVESLSSFISRSACRLNKLCIIHHEDGPLRSLEQYQFALPTISNISARSESDAETDDGMSHG
ncbi:F-box domain-containing protein [Favolaschia claudopus]|uniref:F-box domain-containing protein n=1 Tax=Favolaschia claudopus TaxID=2862362 RepID=A0AAW0A6D7_9AGAR